MPSQSESSQSVSSPHEAGLPAAEGRGICAADHADHVRRLFEEHNRALVSFLTARLNSLPEARDVAQEAYARLLQLDNPGAVSFLRAYLFRIAANLAMDRHRERKTREDRTPREFLEALVTLPSLERTVLAEQQLAVMVAALDELPEKCREVFALHYFAEKNVPDIALSMGLGSRMVQKYLARALSHCRARLDGGVAAGGRRRRRS